MKILTYIINNMEDKYRPTEVQLTFRVNIYLHIYYLVNYNSTSYLTYEINKNVK